ncbi:helix-turn-helix domain-containing protein [Chryseobacterium sp. C39-AII1]|uniref:helix-turn-helix domain-containing protein n=1 Tax=Chryseobacterium sp. C39-AII1 TaxID=3080332 RepID=UPI003208A0B8
MTPNYKKIYYDIFKEKYPEQLDDPQILYLLDNINTIEDVLKVNALISESSRESEKNNQRLKNYDKATVLKLLQYQKKHNLSTNFMSKKHKMSRTTIMKWWKIFGEEIL